MKGLIFVVSALLSFNAFSYTPAEINRAEDYLYDICMDTYCGGDLVYGYPTILCKDKSCTVNMEAKSYSDEDNAIIKKIEKLEADKREGNAENVYWKVNKMTGSSYDEEEERSYATFSFSCELSNLEASVEEDVEDIFYDSVVTYCIPQIENFYYGLYKL